jgi:GT2 family glycosyltransferase
VSVSPPESFEILEVGAKSPDQLNEELGSISSEFVALVTSRALLEPNAVGEAVKAFQRFPATDLIYGDSMAPGGHGLLDRPGFSPLRLRSQDYLGDVLVVRTELLGRIEGFRAGLDGVHLYDVDLRAVATVAQVLHLPLELSFSDRVDELLIARRSDRKRPADPYLKARMRAIEDHLAQLGVRGDVEQDDQGTIRIRYPVVGEPRVSLIIPTRGSSATIAGRSRVLVTDAIRGILERSTYQNIEFVVVADGDTPQSVIDDLVDVAGERLRLVRWTEPFNFSAKINRGAVCATGEYLLPLNDDIELVTPDWIEVMLGLAQQSSVGLVGVTLFFEDGSIQHAGHLYRDGAAGHVALGWDLSWDDRLGSLSADREVSGVTAACAMVRADSFWKVGGFSALLPGNYNDVDFCMKIRAQDLSIVWTPHVRLYHFESKSRVATIAPSELDTIRGRWARLMHSDEYWSLP